ncbi:hypothetical protein C0J52_11568 [Blattella germanica]|nr:hypothetical protein C0J52_11568 [Blattella germanica]
MLGTEVCLAGGVVYYPVEEGVRKDSEHSTEMYSKTYKACFIKLHISRKFQLRFLSYQRFQTCATQERTTGIRV